MRACVRVCVRVRVCKGMVLYSAVSSPLDRSKRFPPLADLFIPTPFSASLGSILAMQQLRNDYSLTFPPLCACAFEGGVRAYLFARACCAVGPT